MVAAPGGTDGQLFPAQSGQVLVHGGGPDKQFPAIHAGRVGKIFGLQLCLIFSRLFPVVECGSYNAFLVVDLSVIFIHGLPLDLE